MKRMIHPMHGAHHAMNANEEAQMRVNGWTAEDDAPPAAVTAEDDAPPAAGAPVRRVGRPSKNKD